MVNEDKSNNPRCKRTKAERATLCSGSKIANADKSGQATKVRRDPGTRSSRPIREQSHPRGISLPAKKRRRTNPSMENGRTRKHAHVHGRGVETVAERTTSLILLKLLGVEHSPVAKTKPTEQARQYVSHSSAVQREVPEELVSKAFWTG